MIHRDQYFVLHERENEMKNDFKWDFALWMNSYQENDKSSWMSSVDDLEGKNVVKLSRD